MNETARDFAETKRGLKNQIQERGASSEVHVKFSTKMHVHIIHYSLSKVHTHIRFRVSAVFPSFKIPPNASCV